MHHQRLRYAAGLTRRPLWESLRYQASAAPSGASPTAADAAASPKLDPAVTFFKEFIVSQIDYHTMLVQEANKKHNVPLNIPPQLNPPTDEHVPVYCDVLGRKMQEPERHFSFAPLHGPPPHLPEMDPKIEKRGPPPPLPTTPLAAMAKAKVGKAMPLDDSKPFRCSVCNKTFRVAQAAEQHLESHKGVADAKIIDESVKSSADVAKTAAAAATPATPAKPTSALSSGPNPLLELVANMPQASAAVNLAPLEPPVLFALPTDTEIDSLLVETWDGVGKKVFGAEYKPITSYIIGNTDPEQASKDGAAGATLLAGVSSSMTSNLASIAAPSTNVLASQLARPTLSVGGFTSPFINANNFNAPPPEDYMKARLERKFKCDLCNKAFRLADAAINHYDVVHGTQPSPAKLAEFKALDNPGVPALAEVSKQLANAEAKDKAAAEEATRIGADGAAPVAEATLAEAAQHTQAPMPEVELAAHIRAASNAVILGKVRELRYGYVKADPVAQLILEVDWEEDVPPAAAAAAAAAPTAAPSASGDAAATASGEQPPAPATPAPTPTRRKEVEYVTVRCYGDMYSDLLKPTLEQGSTVIVHGSLKLNFQLDADSGEARPYPFIKVVPPYGMVTQLA